MKSKAIIKKGIAWFLTAAMVTGLTPVIQEPTQVQAATTKTIAGLGTNIMADPTAPVTSTDPWKGSYVWYGKYDVERDGTAEPIKYRVLDKNTTDYGGTTMLLDCDSILYTNSYYLMTPTVNSSAWIDSYIRSYINGSGFLTKAETFTTMEKNAITLSTKEATASSDGKGWNYTGFLNLKDDKIFFLAAQELTRTTYGYYDNQYSSTSRVKKSKGVASPWWTRSLSTQYPTQFIYADYDGTPSSDSYSINMGVSPAFNVNLSSILFSSVVTGTAGQTGAEYKLTLLDSNMSVTPGNTIKNGNVLTIPYTISGTDSGSTTQVSVLALDKTYTAGNTNNATVLAYGKLSDVSTTSGSATYILPSNLSSKTLGTDYHLYLVAEDVNGENETDYASTPVEITNITMITSVTSVAITQIATPTPEQSFPTTANLSYNGLSKTATISWKKGTTAVSGKPEWNTAYQASTTISPASGYAFTSNTKVTLGGTALATSRVTLNNDGTLTVDCGTYTTAKRKFTGVTAPTSPTQFTKYYTASDILSSTELGTTAKTTLEGTTTPTSVNMKVTWSIASGSYSTTPGATNTFKWAIKPEEYANYNLNSIKTEGTVSIKNKDYTPVVINGDNVTLTYNGQLDVSQYFDIDKNAGTPTYTLLSTSTGTGTLNGSILTMNTLGKFAVKVTTASNGNYGSTEYTITITVAKATPSIEKLPTVAGRTYNPNKNLLDTDITGGVINGVDGNQIRGTWSWKKTGGVTPIPEIGNNSYTAIFTPEDIAHYDIIETAIAVTVGKATPYVKTSPTATAITYGQILSNSILDNAVACISDTDNTEIMGAWSWKDATVKPAVSDSDMTAYTVVFTPKDTDHYNTVETNIAITVKKALPYIHTIPDASAIVYGESLKSSTLSGASVWSSRENGTELPGTWSWKDDAVKPTLADSDVTEYTAVFSPKDSDNYNVAETDITVTVNRIATTPGMPTSTISTVYTNKTVEAVSLPEGWVWQDSDKTKSLVVGEAVKATAVYNGEDKGIYEIESVEISITRQACTHAGETEIRETLEPTCGEEGYTGNTYCLVCEDKIETGEIIEKKAHVYGEPEFKWSEDGKTCSALFTCENDVAHTDTQDATVASEVKTVATCKDSGVTTYTATCKFEDKTYTSSKDVHDIPIDVENHVGETEVRDSKESTCGEEGYTGDTYCKSCNKKLETGKAIEKKTHVYGEPELRWSEDGNVCTVVFTCENNSEHTVVMDAVITSEVKTAATCKDKGVTTFTATCKFGDKTYTNSKDVQNIPLNSKKHVGDTEVRNSKEATCGDEGYTGDTYCKACNGKISTGEAIERKAHIYNEPDFSWREDSKACTIIFTCKNNSEHKITMDVAALPTIKSSANCISKGTTTYTVSYTLDNKIYTDSKDVQDIPVDAKNHIMGVEVRDVKEATCGEAGYTGNTYCKACGEKLADGKTIDMSSKHTWDAGVITQPATETEEGGRTYTCTVCGTTKVEKIPVLESGDSSDEDEDEDDEDDEDDENEDKGVTRTFDDNLTGIYVATESDLANGVVSYAAPIDERSSVIIIPDTVTINGIVYKIISVEKNAFRDNKYVTKVIMGNNLIKIGDNAFYGCDKLTAVQFGKNTKTIGNKAFYKCIALKNIILPSKVTKIGNSAFEGCKNLTTVTIGRNVKTIGSKAFYGCNKLKKVIVKSLKLTTKKVGSKAFGKTPKSMTVRVPKKKFESYKSMLRKKGVSKKARFKKQKTKVYSSAMQKKK